MGLLYASELKDPNEWIGQNAEDILNSVRQVGGWKTLFPSGVPTWLHKIHHQGSYNFCETAVHGLDCHEKYDVETHHKDPVYVDPPDRFVPLKQRLFQEWVLAKAGAKTRMSRDFDEPPMRRKPHSV